MPEGVLNEAVRLTAYCSSLKESYAEFERSYTSLKEPESFERQYCTGSTGCIFLFYPVIRQIVLPVTASMLKNSADMLRIDPTHFLRLTNL